MHTNILSACVSLTVDVRKQRLGSSRTDRAVENGALRHIALSTLREASTMGAKTSPKKTSSPQPQIDVRPCTPITRGSGEHVGSARRARLVQPDAPGWFSQTPGASDCIRCILYTCADER